MNYKEMFEGMTTEEIGDQISAMSDEERELFWNRLFHECSEDERVEAFAWALSLLTEEELDQLILMCADIIEDVQARAAASA